MHIDFALPVDHDLSKGFEEWQVRAPCLCTSARAHERHMYAPYMYDVSHRA